MRGAFVQASFRSSAAVMGLAFIQNMYGSSAMGPLMIVSAVPLYNIFSVIVLTFEGAHSGEGDPKQKVKDACINIAKNPIILGILAGLVVGLLGIDFPVIVDKTVVEKNPPDDCGIHDQAGHPAAHFSAGRCVDGISRGADDRNSDHAGIADDAELLHHGEEHGQRRCTHRERDRDDDTSGGIYPDRMDLYFEDSRIDRVKVLDVF